MTEKMLRRINFYPILRKKLKFHLSDFQVELRIAINRIAINKHFILTHANPRFDSPWL